MQTGGVRKGGLYIEQSMAEAVGEKTGATGIKGGKKMKSTKKFLALGLVVAMTAATLAGCGGSGNNAGTMQESGGGG